jgi:SHS2 domain-containing protein
MPSDRFEIVEHTGDLAVRLWGQDPADLLRSGGIALFYLIAGGSPVRESVRRQVEARGADLEEMLVGWMNRLLQLHVLDRLLLSRFDPEPPSGGSVHGVVAGETIVPGRHRIHREIKGVTYHDVAVERRGDRWTARVILDV